METLKHDIENLEHNGLGSHTEKQEDVQVTPTVEEEQAIIKKLDTNLLPAIFLIYSLSVLDRSNLGNAHVAGLDQSIGLVGNDYSILGSVFYVTYIVFQFGAAGWKAFPAHIWVFCIVVLFATFSTLQAAVHNFGGLLALRLLLGASEALYAGLPVYLSYFYPRHKVGFRQGIFLSGSALANAYGGALGYAITHIKSSRIEPWRILFLVEGLPTFIMAIVAFFCFPDDIDSARFLTDRQKSVLKQMRSRNETIDEEHVGLRVKDFLAAFTDWKSYLTGLMYFGCNVSFASLPLFVPTIIAEIGTFSSIEANGLSAPPYLLTFFLIIITSFISDRLRMRGPFVVFFAIVSAVGFLLLATTKDAIPRYLGVYLAITIFVSVSLLLAWASNIHATESKRAGGFAIFAALGQAGPLLGTNIFPASEAPYYRKGSFVSFAFCLLVAIVAAIFSLLLHLENKKIDKRATSEEGSSTMDSTNFRYII
ncbi:retrograde regulation protein 2 [Xylariaceae sp. FL0255]|nr:retrograde regulation protein 2 [Xylariaceae sp. FL0255]